MRLFEVLVSVQRRHCDALQKGIVSAAFSSLCISAVLLDITQSLPAKIHESSVTVTNAIAFEYLKPETHNREFRPVIRGQSQAPKQPSLCVSSH